MVEVNDMSCVKGVTRFTGILLVMLAVSAAGVPASTPREIPLWPNGAPGSEGKPAKEDVTTSASGELRVAGIHNPTITPYLPAKEIATGLAILVIPGGGHRMLAITHEGYNVAEWFQAHGIAAFVLKHRLAREPNSTYRIQVESLSDTKRAIRLIRARAKEWNIDPARCPVRHRYSSPLHMTIDKISRRGWPRRTCGSNARASPRSCTSTGPADMGSDSARPTNVRSVSGWCDSKSG
jgi:hypothetical protein